MDIGNLPKVIQLISGSASRVAPVPILLITSYFVSPAFRQEVAGLCCVTYPMNVDIKDNSPSRRSAQGTSSVVIIRT